MKQKISLPSFPIMYHTQIGDVSSEKIHIRDFLLIYVEEGSGNIRICDKFHAMCSGFVCVVSPITEIEISTDRQLRTINIRISKDAVSEFLMRTASSEENSNQYSSGDMPMMVFPKNMLLRDFFAGISGGIRNNYRANEHLVYLKMQECLNILACINSQARNWFFHVSNLHKINLTDFMEKHYMENISLEQMAAASGRSLSTFRRDFIKLFGVTPGKWLLMRRLNEAYKLIVEKAMHPSEIMLDLGFESFSHFSRSFKSQFNIQPSVLYKTIWEKNKSDQ